MSQTKYKLNNDIRGIIVRHCRLYNYYNQYNLYQKITSSIDDSRKLIGNHIESNEVRHRLINAVWHSTCDAKNYPYERWNIPTVSRNEFYECKRKFIYDVAVRLGYI